MSGSTCQAVGTAGWPFPGHWNPSLDRHCLSAPWPGWPWDAHPMRALPQAPHVLTGDPECGRPQHGAAPPGAEPAHRCRTYPASGQPLPRKGGRRLPRAPEDSLRSSWARYVNIFIQAPVRWPELSAWGIGCARLTRPARKGPSLLRDLPPPLPLISPGSVSNPVSIPAFRSRHSGASIPEPGGEELRS